MRFEQLDVRQATEQHYAVLTALENLARAERLPDDPPVPLDEAVSRWQNIPAFQVPSIGSPGAMMSRWRSRGPGWPATGPRTTSISATFRIYVRPDVRHRGIATQFLGKIAEVTEREGWTLLTTSSTDHVPAGAAFLRRIGAQVGLESRITPLELNDVDRALLRRWIDRAQERANNFELLVWTEGYPEAELDRIAELFRATNQAPRGDLRIEDAQWTPEEVSQIRRADSATGNERWLIVARERDTGTCAGFTEVVWHPNRPELLEQGSTAVLAPYQNRGLGRWLKAAMMEKVLRERPEVKRIRTGNADANAPMLKINDELGFRPLMARRSWQVDLSQVKTYLAGARTYRTPNAESLRRIPSP